MDRFDVLKRNSSTTFLYPIFKKRLLKGILSAQNAGIPVRLFETFRSPPRQQYLFNKGRTTPGNIITRARAGDSYHNYGIAADLVMHVNGRWSWSHMDFYKALVMHMTAHGLESLNKQGDWPHYQLSGLSIEVIKRYYSKGGFPAVWLGYLDKLLGDD